MNKRNHLFFLCVSCGARWTKSFMNSHLWVFKPLYGSFVCEWSSHDLSDFSDLLCARSPPKVLKISLTGVKAMRFCSWFTSQIRAYVYHHTNIIFVRVRSEYSILMFVIPKKLMGYLGMGCWKKGIEQGKVGKWFNSSQHNASCLVWDGKRFSFDL